MNSKVESKVKPSKVEEVMIDRAQIIIAAIAEWQEANPPEKLRQEIFDELKKNQKVLVMKMLGFKQDWGNKWEMDTNNKDSLVFQYMKEQAIAGAKEWISQLSMPTVSETFKKEYEKEARRNLENVLRSELYEMIKVAAQEIVAEVKHQLINTIAVDDYKKMMAVLENKD